MPRRQLVGRFEPRRGAAAPLGVAALCVLAMTLVWAVAELIPAVQWKDAVVLHDFTLLSGPRVDGPTRFLLHLLNPLQFVLWGVALMALAVARERPRVALAVAAVMGLAPLTAEMLKPLLAHPHLSVGGVYIGAASWPSGHATAALALVYAALLVAPSRMRPLVACIGAVFVLADRLCAADPRLAHAQRRARRLPDRDAVGGARAGGAALLRPTLAAARPALVRARLP